MKKLIILSLVLLVILTGCSRKSEAEIELEGLMHDYNLRQEEKAKVDISEYIVTSNLSVALQGKKENGLYYVKGQITNTHDSIDVDKIIRMVILDEDGGIITVRPYVLKVKRGESTYFEELAGLSSEIKVPDTLKLDGF